MLRADEVIEQAVHFRLWHFSDLTGQADDVRS